MSITLYLDKGRVLTDTAFSYFILSVLRPFSYCDLFRISPFFVLLKIIFNRYNNLLLIKRHWSFTQSERFHTRILVHKPQTHACLNLTLIHALYMCWDFHRYTTSNKGLEDWFNLSIKQIFDQLLWNFTLDLQQVVKVRSITWQSM